MTMHLPENFLDEMKRLLQAEYPAYLNSFSMPKHTAIRVNTGKITPEEFAAISPFALTPVPWTTNGFYVSEEAHVTKHPYYYAGLYYVQEPSAMLPAAVLDAKPGERVLDLCAAPGGKSTEIAGRIGNEGLLVANDISHSRAKALLKNLELNGSGNIMVCSAQPQKLADVYPSYFDKILIDAPCSGEGMFRKDPAMVKSYEQRGPQAYAQIQKEIVLQAVQLLRPGGRLLYSTCTFSEIENEGTIAYLLQQCPQMRLLCAENIPGGVYSRVKGLEGCVRMYPHKVNGEGHFAALLEKLPQDDRNVDTARRNGDFFGARAAKRGAASSDIPAAGRRKPGNSVSAWETFCREALRIDFSERRLCEMENRIYALPSEEAIPGQIRFLRTGLLLGEAQRGRFEPSQALAMYLKPQEVNSAVSFSADDARVIRYLKGETVELTDDEANSCKGWTLVCVDGFSLGWAKYVGGSLRNKYFAGWRMQ